jgi:DNA-binding transcriptional ArsR family regulator
MRHDGRAAVLAALREVYDGAWTRHVGTDGGRTLHWQGKVGLLAGCTPTIDRHHAVMAIMGERFTLFRHRPGERREQALSALSHTGRREKAMRSELADAVRALFADGFPRQPRELADDETEFLATLASFVATCRSPVERDPYRREIELVPDEEAPTRLAVALERLLAGLDAIGIDRTRALRLVARVGRDSMPALRANLIDGLQDASAPRSTTEIAETVGYPTSTTRRALEDLTAHGVVVRYPQGEGKADVWRLADEARVSLEALSQWEAA